MMKHKKTNKQKSVVNHRKSRFRELCVLCITINAILLCVFVTQPIFEGERYLGEVPSDTQCKFNDLTQRPENVQCAHGDLQHRAGSNWVVFYRNLLNGSCSLFLVGILFGLIGIATGRDLKASRKRFNSLIMIYGMLLSSAFNAYVLGKTISGVVVFGYNYANATMDGDIWVYLPSLIPTQALVIVWSATCLLTIVLAYFTITETLSLMKNSYSRASKKGKKINSYHLRLYMVITFIFFLLYLPTIPFDYSGKLLNEVNQELRHPQFENNPPKYYYLTGDNIHILIGNWDTRGTWENKDTDRSQQLRAIDNSCGRSSSRSGRP